MAEKPQKIGKEACEKDWLKKEMEKFKNPEKYKAKTGGRKREISGQNGRVGISGTAKTTKESVVISINLFHVR